MEEKESGQDWEQETLNLNDEDEQASSDEESSLFQQQDGYTVTTRQNSMYSRIHQDVQSRIPDIDFNSVEVDGELNDDVIRDSFLPSNEINGQDDVETSKGSKDAEKYSSWGLSENGIFVTNNRSEDEMDTFNVASDGNHTENLEERFSANADGLNGDSMVKIEREIDLDVSAHLNHRISNGCGAISDIDLRFKNENNTDVVRTNSSLEGVTDEKNPKLQIGEQLKLENNIDENNLDRVLGNLDSNNVPLANRNHSVYINTTSNNDKNEGDDELPLMQKLSSFALSEKTSISETNLLLEQLSKSSLIKGLNASDGAVADVPPYNKRIKNAKQEKGMAQGTVFLDLRDNIQSFHSSEVLKKNSMEESSSESEDDDWSQVRRNFKAGLDLKNSLKLDKLQNANVSENKIHDRISKRAYERLMKNHNEEGIVGKDLKEHQDYISTVNSGMGRSWSREEGNRMHVTTEKGKDERGADGKGTSSFDLEPLEDKIRSWHQLNDVNDLHSPFENNVVLQHCEREQFSSTSRGEKVLNDSSLLGLEDTGFNLENVKNTRQSLLIVEERIKKDEMLPVENEKAKDESSLLEINTGNRNEKHGSCCIVELADKVRISDNLLLIQANIADETQSNQNESMSQNIDNLLWDKKDESIIPDDLKHDLNDVNLLACNEGRDVTCKNQMAMLSLEEVEKNLLANERNDSVSAAQQPESTFEMEMKTFSVAECNDVDTNGEEMVELSSTIRGLLPQYDPQMFNKYLDSKRAKTLYEKGEEKVTGEETPMTKRQGSESKRGTEVNATLNLRTRNKVTEYEDDQNVSACLDEEIGNCEKTIDKTGNNKSKKKSKKKNRKSSENVNEKQSNEEKTGNGKITGNNTNECIKKISKKLTAIENEIKKKPKCLVKENDRINIEDKIKLLQGEYGLSNVIFDEKVSYTSALKSLPSKNRNGSRLMLKVQLEAPGICSKACAKNSLSYKERSDAYIGLCTLFISLLHGSKFKVCETLNIPFDVIALKQASIDSELQLVVGVAENDVQIQSAQNHKRGKSSKVKKNFHQTVTQYLNKTDLEFVLSDLMDFDFAQKEVMSTVMCPGSRKLSSYITVSQDETAVARIFSLKPSLMWKKIEETGTYSSDDIFWMKGKQKRNENTCAIVENITSMLPRTIATFFTTARNNSLDICGLRVAYTTTKDNNEEPTLVAAFRGPNVTTAQEGKSFIDDTHELASVKSVFMPCGNDSPCEDKDVVICLPKSIKTFNTCISDPLITYTIGRRRGEREVVNWFGRRTLSLSDVDFTGNDISQVSTKPHFSSLPEKLDVLSRLTASSSLLTIVNNRVLLSMSDLVPSVIISVAMGMAESRGLHAVSAGKVLVNEEDAMHLGLKIENEMNDAIRNETKPLSLHRNVAFVVFEGENAIYRAQGLVRHLFKNINGKLPLDALTKDAVKERLNGLMKYAVIKQDRNIDEFFGFVQLDKKVLQIIEKATANNLSRLDNEIINVLPSNWKLFVLPEMPRICTAVFVGKPMVEIFPYILNEIFKECIEDPFCINTNATTERKFRQQERPVGELIGLKYYANLTKHVAHILCPYVVGAKGWSKSVEQIQQGPVIVLVVRLLDSMKKMDEKCHNICRHVCKLLNSNELNSPSDSNYDAYTYTDLDTIFRVMVNMFKVDELMPDTCPTWFKNTQWPVYLSTNNAIMKRLDPILNLLSNTHKTNSFRHEIEPSKQSIKPSQVRILSPLSMNIPADLILGKQVSLSFIEFGVDCNFSKYIPKILGILRRDSFDVVGLNFPSGYSPSFESTPKMHVVLRRRDAVFRLNQWLPELTNELHNKHSIKVSISAKEAFDSIVRNFQKTESGGIFDESNLSSAEKLTFKCDDVYNSRNFRKVNWTSDVTSTSDSKNRVSIGSSNGCCVMPEINVIIITNVMMRGSFLDEYISENAKFLGFWEHLSSVGFKTIGARMTSLHQDQVNTLLDKLKLPPREHAIMEKRMTSSNGPIFALVLLKDFALSNFWRTTKSLTEEECKIIRENVLIPSSRAQVEVLLSSLFETIVPNSEVEIKKVD